MMGKATVVGAGTMGAAIAQVFASNGYEVSLIDVTIEFAEKGYSRIENSLAKLMEKGKVTAEEKNQTLNNITISTSMEQCAGSCIAIEAISENMQLKHSVFQELEKYIGEEALLVSNTSSLSITEIAAALKHKERFLGMHFFNPPIIMKLVEIIKGEHTSRESMEKTIHIAQKIGKVPVCVNERAGFVVNRILIPMINEGIGVYADGVASAEDIDVAMKLGANHPMGPLALGDLVGLDVCLAIMEVLYAETGDTKYRPHPLLRKMVRAGKLGRKTGLGFFCYTS